LEERKRFDGAGAEQGVAGKDSEKVEVVYSVARVDHDRRCTDEGESNSRRRWELS